MSHLTLDLQTHREEENHHKYVIDELLDGHVMREEPVHLAVRALEVYLDIGLKERPIVCAHSGQIGQQHGYDDAQQEQYALCPRLTGQFVTLTVELEHAPVPCVYGD